MPCCRTEALQGCQMLLTSARADEEAQHFYRRLGCEDCGGFAVGFPGDVQPMEFFLIKKI